MNMQNDIKRLAKAALRTGSLDREVADFAITRLSRKELAQFRLYFDKMLMENAAIVMSSRELAPGTKEHIESIFSGKIVFYTEDRNMGEGIIVTVGDNRIDLSFNGYIYRALDELGKA
jgi:hypothetical protein